jgi:putative tryptophan/tyrosine transport system substrate-binding protein
MRRREVIALLGGAATAWPLAARAQQPAQIKRVGMLMGFANDALGQVSVKAFQQELERLGWAEGRSVAFEFRWAEGRSERFADFAAEFVRLRVDVILTTATPSTAAAMQATSKIPIVFVGSGDPVGSGLVTSLARPGGNVTGLSNQNPDVASKGPALSLYVSGDPLVNSNALRINTLALVRRLPTIQGRRGRSRRAARGLFCSSCRQSCRGGAEAA